jgi:hypothetical protein
LSLSSSFAVAFQPQVPVLSGAMCATSESEEEEEEEEKIDKHVSNVNIS